MRRFVSLFLLMLCCGWTLMAQTTQQRQYVTVTFMPNHDSWLYQCGEKVEMQVQVMQFNVPLKNTKVNLSWGMEMSKADENRTINTGKTGIASVTLPGSKVPGFKTLSATVTVEGKDYWNYITVGFEPEKIEPTTPMPKDFLEFWNGQLAAARKTPLEPLFTLQPDLCTPYSDAYMVRYQNDGSYHFFYGIIRVPKGVNPVTGTTRYPALLEVPGAGVRSYKGMSDDFTKAGIITLQIGIHGIPVNLPDEVYRDLKNVALSNYNANRYEDRNAYYYKHVYTGCVRAIDLLCSMSIVDSTRIAVTGGSQGGLLSLVVAGLAPDHIYCVSTAYPAMSEVAGSMRGRIDGWPRLFNGNKKVVALEEKIKVSEYYDAVSFARLVKAPMLFIQGFNDRTCPPTTTYSVYNVLDCEKEIVLPKDCAHWLYGETWNQRRDWLIEKLNTK